MLDALDTVKIARPAILDAIDAVKIARPAMLDAAAVASFAAADALAAVEPMAFEFRQDRSRDREAELREREAELRQRERERESEWYSQGMSAADEYRWDRALMFFNRVVDSKGSKLDAALYWKAFSQNRLGQRSEALTTIAELAKNHPGSAYRKQATVLEAEVRRDIGQPVRPQDSADDEVKLMALQALQNTAPEEAVPLLEKVLEGTASGKVKRRALFVLAQSKSPKARDVLRNYAKGSSTPDLQSQAIQYLGVQGGPESRAVLAEVYTATSDVDVKRRILRAFMVAGEKDRLFKAAQGEQNPELRAEAVGQLGNMSAHEELWQLYQKETSVDVKRRIIRSMQNGGSVDRLIELAKAEQSPELRRDVVRALGVTRTSRTGDVLVQVYNSDTNVDVRKSVVNALFIQENATAMVALARKEQDIVMKKELVSRLSQMRSKVATDYMIELLK
jgi:HEAT repeat protein